MKIKFLLLSIFLFASCASLSNDAELATRDEGAPSSPSFAANAAAPRDAQSSAKSVSADEAGRAKQDVVPN
jgi:hypothetical protein